MSIFTDDSVKTIKVLNGSTDITDYVKSDSFSVENILCDSQLAFGTCNSARAQMTTITDLNLTGATITVQFGAGATFENIGVYTVTYSAQTANSDEVVVTMYDCVKAFDVDVSEWYENLSFPMSLATFRAALCSYVGVTAETVTLVNDSMTIYKTISPSQLNGKDMLRYIGEINGVFPHATRTGTFTWLSLGTSATTIPETLIQGSEGVEQKDYTTASISGLYIRTEDGDVGVAVGSGTNIYFVTANVLCYGLTTEQLTPIATALYNKIYAVQYVPTSISMKCIPTYEMGALLSYGGNRFYILSKTTSGLMFDEITCEGNEYLTESNSVQTQLEQLRGKSAVLTADIEGISSRVTNIEEDYTTYTEFSQTADEISLAIVDLQNEIDGSIEIIYTNEAPTLTNYPAWDWTDMRAYDSEAAAALANDTAYTASDDLYFLYNDDGYDPHRRTMVYDQTNSVTYRFVKSEGQWVWQVLENTEFSVVLEKISNLELTTDSIEASVSSLTADLNDNYYTISETTSLLSQTSTSIMASVSGTYATKDTTTNLQAQIEVKIDPTNLISSINESADVIELEGHRISITSDYFTLDTDGSIVASDLTINGGKIAVSSTGWVAPTTTELDQLRSYVLGEISLTTAQKRAYDFTGDGGNPNLLDWSYLKSFLMRGVSLPSAYTYIDTTVSVLIDPSNPEKLIEMSGTNSWGNAYDTYFGCDKMVVPRVKTANIETTYINMVSGSYSDATIEGDVQFTGTVYNSSGGSVFVSDRDKKENIASLDREKSSEFIYSLNPCEFSYKENAHGRLHHGLIAQDVKKSMGDDDWGLYIERPDGEKGLRYYELIADLIATVQEQNERIKELESKIKEDN